MSDRSENSDASDASDASDFSGVILAAGEGRRAGGNKLLWPLGDGTVIDLVIQTQSTICSRVRVVAGAYYEELRNHISRQHPGVQIIFNKEWESGGMFSSVQAGLSDVETACFVQPGDIPGATPDVYRVLGESYSKNRGIQFIKPIYKGRGGHPILLSREAVAIAKGENPASNLRAVLGKLNGGAVPVDEPLILHDIDTGEQYLELKSIFMRGKER